MPFGDGDNREDDMTKQITFEFAGQSMTAAGIGHLAEPDLIALFEHVGAAVAKRMKGRNILNSWDAVTGYLRATMAFQPKEQFRVLYLDKRNQLLNDEIMQTGTVDHVPVFPREVMKRALEIGASALLLVHNHPSGDTTPSRADIEMTKTLIEAGKIFGITIHDHVIVGRDGNTSLRGSKLI